MWTDNPTHFLACFPSSEITFFTADSGDVAAAQATPHVIISDIDFHMLPADVQAELSNPNFYAVGPVGNFTIRGVLFQPWLQNVKQDSGHTLWVDINLGASIAAPLAVAGITSEATLVSDLWPASAPNSPLALVTLRTAGSDLDHSFVLSAPDQSLYPTGEFSYYILNDYDAQRVPGPAPAAVIGGQARADFPGVAAETFALLDRVVTYTDARTRYLYVYALFIRYADAERNIYQDSFLRIFWETEQGGQFRYFAPPTAPVIPPTVTPTLAAVAATETATIEAGDTAQTVDVTAWYTATDVVPTYALSGAPSWITLSGSTLTIAPASDVAAADYTATVTASGTGVSDVVVTLTVTVTAVPVPVPSASTWSLSFGGTLASAFPSLFVQGGADTQASSTWTMPAAILNNAAKVRITTGGTAYTFRIIQFNRMLDNPADIDPGARAGRSAWFSLHNDETPTLSTDAVIGDAVEFLDSSDNVITDGPTNI